ncbi:ATP-binding protein [Dolichospermum sp. ST_con]|nr:ATP-binding protein [Dolichospermum sp. ST_con]MDD1419528.1 ATP-binding protein [Dolichospermum sp. ST_sed1]MDD1424142.1 ATP-binding protein [Dolichospermum sp. ST_sed9]MDD1430595.1 ATP-binding protein [Dolichospermum sp. ST_sed6]MDD1437447.1 ATP-binding protein [Dolichospermum sp. ST_sed10]MDD1439950.1 ATP-binding protein [Dolichospermum sp. ST_sed3]MDD1445868.1 ATP-binding protein [Dolichospermum sp. ST_sed8]MDD1457312.1 ATP-binding protein [Dolichospermum sp. ST_sed7]MDD1458713.1 ATP-
MQKIIIKNFGAIKYAEIEIKKTLVLIGEQASGKSTIAKLIYFFKTIKDDLFSQIYRDKNHSNLEPYSDIVYPTRQKFQNFFGSTSRFSDFEIIFYYSIEKDKFLKLTIDENKTLRTNFSPNLLNNDNFKTSASSIKRRIQQRLNENNIRGQLQLFDEEEKIRYAQQLYTLLNESFESNQTNSLFIIAGRNATLSYSDLFEKYLFASISEDDRNEISERNKRKIQTIDETLMLQFMKNVVNTKDTFKKFGNFEGLIDDNAENKAKLYLIKNRINEILKGEYIIDFDGSEKIMLNTEAEEYVYLANASSGQQESIRILQDIFLNILDNAKVLRILEEPEAHLFPIAQKQLIELLSLMVNQNDDNQLIITTHSPYVLTVFNNLLFANRVVEKNPSGESEVTEIIPKDCWLSAKDFSAYSLGNQSVAENTNYCEPIFNNEKGTIKQNYLDTVSEILGGDFQALYSIHAKTFARR